MNLKFTKSTDSQHKVTLESNIIYAEWRQLYAPIGQTAGFEIGTVLVGEGAPIEVKGKSHKGKNLGKVTGKVRGNKFTGEFNIPDDTKIGDVVTFEAKLTKHGLSMPSNAIAAVPPIKVMNLQWRAKEARRGDVLTLSATAENVPDGAIAKLIIYEYDQDSSHDKITEIPTVVKNNKIEVQWGYEYHEDTDEIPTEEQMNRYGRNYNPPEYFFTVKIDDQEFGKSDQASGLLEFKDWFEVTLQGENGEIVPNEEFVLKLANGTERKGKLDENGKAKEDDLPPGIIFVEFPKQNQVNPVT